MRRALQRTRRSLRNRALFRRRISAVSQQKATISQQNETIVGKPWNSLRVRNKVGTEIHQGPAFAVFDFANTLFCGPYNIVAAAMEKTFGYYGIDNATFAICAKHTGPTKKQHMKSILLETAVNEQFQTIFRRKPDHVDLDEMYEIYVVQQLKLIKENLDLITLNVGAERLLHGCMMHGVRMYGTTGFPADIALLFISYLNSRYPFAGFLTAADHDTVEDMVKSIASVEEGKDGIGFGDTPTNGKAFRNAGLQSYLVSSTSALLNIEGPKHLNRISPYHYQQRIEAVERELEPHADKVIRSLNDFTFSPKIFSSHFV
jgi:hypothetical protein